MTIKACVVHCLYSFELLKRHSHVENNEMGNESMPIPKWNRFDYSQWPTKMKRSDGIEWNNNDDDEKKIWHVKAIELFIVKMLDYEHETENRIREFTFVTIFFFLLLSLYNVSKWI